MAEGRPWLARDRLTGVLSHRVADSEVLGLLGDAYWALSDQAGAGRYWFLSDRHGPEVDRALEAWRAATPSATRRDAWVRLRLSGCVLRLPSVAEERAASLRREAAAEGGNEGDPSRKTRRSRVKRDVRRSSLAVAAGRIGVAVVFTLTVGVWLFGIVELVRMLVG